MIAGITVTVVRPPAKDVYGNPGTAPATEHDIDDCAIALRSGEDILDRAREGVVADLVLYCPAGSDILHADQVRINSGMLEGLYTIEGRPFDWVSPFTGWNPGIEVALRHAEG